MLEEQIEITDEYRQCLEYVEKGARFVFVSGGGGTGKSVLIDVLRKRFSDKRQITVAPTGAAALNVGGATIHSVFYLPIGILTEEKLQKTVAALIKYNQRDFFNALDMIIVDEVSMLRADQLDAMDFILKKLRRTEQLFGGVQMVFVGDLFQLPPVLTTDEKAYFFSEYKSEYFFSAKSIRLARMYEGFSYVELTKTFRQADKFFIDILESVRLNERVDGNLILLNKLCYESPCKWDMSDSVVLCATNRIANHINTTELLKIESDEIVCVGRKRGEFKIQLTTPEELKIKVGAKVMFTRNNVDGGWVNGTLGIVTDYHKGDDPDKDLIAVKIKLDNGDETVVCVGREKWSIFKYKLNPDTEKLVEVNVGEFEQFPLTLAYAQTIHKSQGSSLDKVEIDLGSGAFAAGQTYVALSRCRTLDGIRLVRPLERKDIFVDPRITDFYKKLKKTNESETSSLE